MTDRQQTFAARRRAKIAPPKVCPKCGAEKTVEVIIQARPVPSRKGSLATRARGMCEPCAVAVFDAAEAILDEGVLA